MIEDKLRKALYDKVKFKRNSTQDLRSIARKIVTKKNVEVMVKITSFGKAGGSDSNLADHIDYISRNKKLELEDNNGFTFAGKDDTHDFVKKWEEDMSCITHRKNRRDMMNLVLSMPTGTDPEAVKNATRKFLKANFANHDYLFVLHTDADGGNPHTHSVIQTLGYDNTRLNPRKDDLQSWRESFAANLQAQGIENAEATPRKVRGVRKRTEKQALKHMETALDAQKMKAVKDELGLYNKQLWLDAAAELEKENLADDKALSKNIRAFVRSLEPSKQKQKSRADEMEL